MNCRLAHLEQTSMKPVDRKRDARQQIAYRQAAFRKPAFQQIKRLAAQFAAITCAFACFFALSGNMAYASQANETAQQENGALQTASIAQASKTQTAGIQATDTLKTHTMAIKESISTSNLGDKYGIYVSTEVTSSDESIVSIYHGFTGVYVCAEKPGTVTLYQFGDPVINVEVKASTLTRTGKKDVSLGVYDEMYLPYKSSMEKAYVSCKSSNPSVVSAWDYGHIMAYKAGKAVVTATTAYGNSISWNVTVHKEKASKVSISRIPKKTFNNKAQKPKIVATLHGTRLTQGTDYKVKYYKNKKIGKAKVVITFKGSIVGKRTKTFKIVAPKVGKPDITYWFEGSAYSTIEWDSGNNSSGTQLKIVGGGNAPYNKHISGPDGYGYCYKSRLNSTVKFSIRSYKKVGKKRFYSRWVTIKL